MTLLLAVSVTRRFYYLTFTVRGCYLLFPLLDISCCWLLLNVSITRHFNYSTFQRPRKDVPFVGLNDVPLNFRGKIPKKTEILGARIGLLSLNEKKFKSL